MCKRRALKSSILLNKIIAQIIAQGKNWREIQFDRLHAANFRKILIYPNAHIILQWVRHHQFDWRQKTAIVGNIGFLFSKYFACHNQPILHLFFWENTICKICKPPPSYKVTPPTFGRWLKFGGMSLNLPKCQIPTKSSSHAVPYNNKFSRCKNFRRGQITPYPALCKGKIFMFHFRGWRPNLENAKFVLLLTSYG